MNEILVLMIIPAAWSGLVALSRLAALKGRPALADGAEKLILGLMLLPVAGGALLKPLASLAPPLLSGPLTVAVQAVDISSGTAPAARAVTALPDLWPALPTVFIALYGLVALFLLVRLGLAHLRLAVVARRAVLMGNVYVSDKAPSAFAWGRHRVVVSTALVNTLPDSDLALIVSHERAHLTRRDPLWFLTLSLVEALLWFNPLIWRQARACRLAAELACDAAVVGAAPTLRHTYARALLTALKHSSGTAPASVPAASTPDAHGYRHRLDQIMTATPRPPRAILWLAAILVLILPISFAQLAFSRTPPASAPSSASGASTPPTRTAAGPAIVRPVDVPISEGFGMRKDPTQGQMAFHEGIDFTAPLGTPVKAQGAGVVSYAGTRAGYGNTIEIDNGGDIKTRYAHLGQIDVKVGDLVTPGQVIGQVGSSGRSTGPHLHFEVWRHHKPVDPAPLFATQP